MKTVGIICEYNPLHLGHKKQIDRIRAEFGEDCGIVCAMSGNYVQRGAPAIVDKSLRAKAAVLSGADLVVELPVTTALSSAEGFAMGGVEILSRLCDFLCFGAETADSHALMDTAQALLSPDFSPVLREELSKGLSFPAARATALRKIGRSDALLQQPNDILAVEYCKAIQSQGSFLIPFPILREGYYHAEAADAENPSATAVRKLMQQRQNWHFFVPPAVREALVDAPLHTMQAGEKAVLARLRTMTDGEFEALPYGSEGLWRKFMHACRAEATLEDILSATKSKRYTRTRLNRMAMCAFLAITREDMTAGIPYTRVLAFSDRGRTILNRAKKDWLYRNAGEPAEHPHWELEKRCGDLYGLFREDQPGSPGAEERRRVYYHKEQAK